MKLESCKDQSSETLEAFYSKLSTDGGRAGSGVSQAYGDVGRAMLSLIAALRALASDNVVWALTSHADLCLLAENRYDSPRYVQIGVLDPHNYRVEYRMREAEAPWPEARIKGEARSEADAIRMIQTAMLESGGWPAM